MIVEIRGEAIQAEIDIAAPPEKVFAALIDPAQLAKWWGSEDTYRTSNWQIDLREGGRWSCEARNASGQLSTVHGHYLEVTPPRLLVYTWNPSWDQVPETCVRLTLEPTSYGTRLSVEHTGFAGHEASQKGHTQGWPNVLQWLSNYCLFQENKK